MSSQSSLITVGVLYGGVSAEHEISVLSAKNVIDHLDPERFEVIPIGIAKNGCWYVGKDVYNHSVKQGQVSLPDQNIEVWFDPKWLYNNTKNANIALSNIDIIFPAVHGTHCEDGTLQGLLEMAGIAYVGCGVLASTVGMDKEISKLLVREAGVAVAPFVAIRLQEWQQQQETCLENIQTNLQYPLFVKPANTGSSIGISKVNHESELDAAINEAFRYDRKVLIEDGLDVLEVEVAVLESLDSIEPLVGVVGQVKPTHEFYSYDAKYLDEKGAELIIPANISETLQEEAQVMAKTIFNALNCEGMARVDLFLDKNKQKLYFNEINTLPGFTKISMFPKMMEARGLCYQNLLSHLLDLALKRHHQQKQLAHCYQKALAEKAS